jgi:MinD-like ATPase involved in chromosome partitioning or flagellar assembly
MGLGSTLASLRGDRVIAVDANPDRGTLSDKLRLETAATVRDLLNERAQIQRYADVRAYTTQAPSRLEVLASDRDPTVSVAFSEQDYCTVAQILEFYYSICLADCGTGLLHSAMTGVLRLADQIVLVSSPSVDGARSASATLDWLQAHGHGDLVRNAVVVLSAVRPRGKSAVDTERLEQHFAARCRAVVKVPYDPHLAEGAEVDLTRLNRVTADAYLMLAAEIGDGFARPQHL